MKHRAVCLRLSGLPLSVLSPVLLLSALLVLPAMSAAVEPAAQPGDWPWWRGPQRNGIADDQPAPVRWSDREHVVWKTPVPGRGHSSPTVVGNRIFLTTADEVERVQSVLCFDRKTGRPLWQTDLHRGGFDEHIHRKNSEASATVACDGDRLFVAFLNDKVVHATALDLDGNVVWQKRVCDFESRYGYSASPALYEDLVIIAADHRGGGDLVAFERASGEERWRTARPGHVTYASPALLHVSGRDQLLIPGCDMLASYDPRTGNELWTCAGTTSACVSTAVATDDLVFASGGFPGAETLAVRGDGSGEAVWRNGQKTYVPSMVVHAGHLYTISDNGIAVCWEAATGKERWKQRLGGNVSSSLVLAGGNLYATNEAGRTFVFRADPQEYVQVAENQLGDEAFATPTFCGGQMFHRVATGSGDERQEWLYCIAR